MIKLCKQKWDENKEKLEESLRADKSLNSCNYLYLVKKVVEKILNDGAKSYKTDQIHEIDDGDYQGTLLYLIPVNTYQPNEMEYLMTFVGYGSCSGCDTLQSIQSWHDENQPVDKEQLKELMDLCLHIVQNITKPYNYGWRHSKDFEPCEE